jgi:hypothetical protein
MHPEYAAFLASFDAASPEHRYHSAVGHAVLSVSFDPASPAQGFALIHLLSQGRLVTDQIDTGVSSIGGSIEENAELVSRLFHRVGHPPAWWKSHYPARIAGQEVQDAVAWWAAQLRAAPAVRAVDMP